MQFIQKVFETICVFWTRYALTASSRKKSSRGCFNLIRRSAKNPETCSSYATMVNSQLRVDDDKPADLKWSAATTLSRNGQTRKEHSAPKAPQALDRAISYPHSNDSYYPVF